MNLVCNHDFTRQIQDGCFAKSCHYKPASCRSLADSKRKFDCVEGGRYPYHTNLNIRAASASFKRSHGSKFSISAETKTGNLLISQGAYLIEVVELPRKATKHGLRILQLKASS
jgi:hypothetical protein